MDSFEWNKIAGAVLFALLVAFGLSIFSEIIFETEAPEEPGYVIATAEGGEGGEAEAPKSIGVLMASADANAGKNSAKKCLACHTFAEGEANKVGPNLWGVVMRPIASHEGYEYSDAMHEFAAEDGNWTYEHLNTFLNSPKDVVPGTKMVFPGLKNEAERANVIAYLRSLSANPEPLPAVEEEPMAAEGEGMAAEEAMAPAEGEPMAEEAESGEAMEPASGEAMEPAAEEAMEPADSMEPMSGDDAMAPAEDAMEPAPSDAMEPAPAEEQQGAAEPMGAEETQMAALPAGDPAKGEVFAKRCLACHTFEAGGPKKLGPPLHGVIGREVATYPDYVYSDAMMKYAEEAKVWEPAVLDHYLTSPMKIVPGTKMVFPGVKSDTDRANVIAYLSTLTE